MRLFDKYTTGVLSHIFWLYTVSLSLSFPALREKRDAILPRLSLCIECRKELKRVDKGSSRMIGWYPMIDHHTRARLTARGILPLPTIKPKGLIDWDSRRVVNLQRGGNSGDPLVPNWVAYLFIFVNFAVSVWSNYTAWLSSPIWFFPPIDRILTDNSPTRAYINHG